MAGNLVPRDTEMHAIDDLVSSVLADADVKPQIIDQPKHQSPPKELSYGTMDKVIRKADESVSASKDDGQQQVCKAFES